MTTGIKLWSTIAGNNSSPPPLGAPEGMAPSGVNDVLRQHMADVRAWYEDELWVDYGSPGLAYFDANNFTVTGDQTAIYQVGRRVRAIGSTPFTVYGRITASVFSSSTKVTVLWDSGSLDNNLSEVALGPSTIGSPIELAPVRNPQTSISSASTTDLGTVASQNANITGTTTINSFGSSASTDKPIYLVKFAGALTLTYNATSLITVSGANIVTAAGDTAVMEYLGSGNWNMREYIRKSGKAVVAQVVLAPSIVFRNLKIAALGVSNRNVVVTADEIFMGDVSGNYQKVTSASFTIASNGTVGSVDSLDTGTLATNAWYAVWAIGDGASCHGIISLATNTVPTMPTGYTYRARLGSVKTDGSGNKYLLQTRSNGLHGGYVVLSGSNTARLPVIANAVTGNVSTPTWATIDVTPFVPPSSSVIKLIGVDSGYGQYIAAPNDQYGPFGSLTNPPVMQSTNPQGQWQNSSCDMLLESTNIYFAGSYSSDYEALLCRGWVENL